jgi:hypothetical protein
MKSIRLAIALSAAIVAVAPSAQAQLRRTTPTQIGTYPGATTVPAGMCQVWINGLPASRQPAPTDCGTARANAPSNSRIIYGSNNGGVYDPRRDPRSAQYDPRYGQYGGQVYPGQRGRGNADWKAEKEREKMALKAQKERDRAALKAQKERGKDWKQENQHGNRDDNDDRGNGRSSNRNNSAIRFP